MASGSRIPGFYKLTLGDRRQVVADRTAVELQALVHAVETGGLDPQMADKLVENVLGVYALPFGLALNVRVNERDYLVPMVVEEPSVIAAASNAARMVRGSGGFHAEMLDCLMTAQIELRDPADRHASIWPSQTITAPPPIQPPVSLPLAISIVRSIWLGRPIS